jgi:hypothetical protein
MRKDVSSINSPNPLKAKPGNIDIATGIENPDPIEEDLNFEDS